MATDLRKTDARTVTTEIVDADDGLRVIFSGMDGGFTADQLDALSVAIFHARRQLNAITEDERLAFQPSRPPLAERAANFGQLPVSFSSRQLLPAFFSLADRKLHAGFAQNSHQLIFVGMTRNRVAYSRPQKPPLATEFLSRHFSIASKSKKQTFRYSKNDSRLFSVENLFVLWNNATASLSPLFGHSRCLLHTF